MTSALWLIAFTSMAQLKLTLHVTDGQNQAIPFASVQLNGNSSKTDPDGKVEFEQLENKVYQVKISSVGYKTQTLAINPATYNQQSIQLIETIFQTEEVYVLATRAKENAATTYKNIGKQELEQSNTGQDVPYLINQTPGVVVGSDAGAGIGYTSMTIRGSDNERINVTLNGIPLNNPESMGSFFVNLPDFASSTQSIQIQRGIGTSTNGPGAFGASLNFQTDALQEQPYAELNNSFGSYNSWKNTIKLGTGLLDNKYAFNARLSRISSDGYVERASSDLKSFYLDAGLYTEKHTLKAIVFSGKEKTYQAWNGLPEPLYTGDAARMDDYADNMGLYGAERERFFKADRRYNQYTYDNQTDNYTQTQSQLHYTYNASEKITLNTALHYTRGMGYYEEYREDNDMSHYGISPLIIGDSTINSTDLIRRRWLDNHFYGLTYSLLYRPTAALNLTFGGAYNQYKGDHYGEVIWARYASDSEINDKYYANQSTKNDFNFFAKADYRLDKWLFNLDIQYRNINYNGKGDDDKIKDLDFQDQLHFINPKAGITYFINAQQNLYLSYAIASKEPTRNDYVENPRNEFPKPENMQNLEAGYRINNEHISLGANVYGMFYTNQLIPTGAINDVGSALRINVKDSYRAGIELDGTWKINKNFHWGATAAFSRNKIKDFIEEIPEYSQDWSYLGTLKIAHASTNIAKSPSTILSNTFTYKPTEAISLSLMSKYISRIFLDNSSDTNRSIDPSFVHNFQAIYSFSALGIKNINLNLLVNNLFNAKYATSGYTWSQQFENEQHSSYYNFYYPQAETNAMLGLNIRF